FDVNLKGDLKAEGIRWLVNYLNYPPEDVFAIGDGMNDISMLKTVNHGIAMGNSHPELLSVATYVTSDVGDEGVANALHHFNLI
ncbi:MAG: HAD hydrolase family protein, partial [Candidatus Izemoplasmatales bacterium]